MGRPSCNLENGGLCISPSEQIRGLSLAIDFGTQSVAFSDFDSPMVEILAAHGFRSPAMDSRVGVWYTEVSLDNALGVN